MIKYAKSPAKERDRRAYAALFFPHGRRSFARGEFLWPPGEPFGRMHYILSGAARCCVEHENGRRKIISFHGAGTLFPVYHERGYRIELAITTEALSPVETLEVTCER